MGEVAELPDGVKVRTIIWTKDIDFSLNTRCAHCTLHTKWKETEFGNSLTFLIPISLMML